MPASTYDKAIILITGANKGIGFQAVKLLSHQLPNATILLATRSLDNGDKAIQKLKAEGNTATDGSVHTFDNVHAIELDVTNKASIEQAAQQVKSKYGRLDVLLCNAGVSGGSGETPETVFAVNIDGVHDTMEAFLPLIPADGLITVVASEVGAWSVNAMPAELQQKLTSPSTVTWSLIQQLEADWQKANKGQPHEQPWPASNTPPTSAYPTSKALIIAYLRSFAQQHTQPKLVIVCPGYCATDLNHHKGHRPASKGGESVCWPVLHPTEAESGAFYQDGKVHSFVTPMPQWAVEGYKKFAEEQAAKARAQGQAQAQ